MGGKGDSTSTVQFHKDVRKHHLRLMEETELRRKAVIDNSPYAGIADLNMDPGLLGTGYVLADFPSLFDMYGKFMAGLDIEVLFNQAFEDTVNAPEVAVLVSAESALLDDEIISNALPRFSTGMRDINSVLSSTFIIGRAQIEDTKTKLVAKFSAELKYRLIPVAVERWGRHLEWNKSVVQTYADMIKLYIMTSMDIANHNQDTAAKNALWPFTILDFERAMVGALNNAGGGPSKAAGGSMATRALSGALSGAAMGSAGGPPGAVIGGILGLAQGLMSG